MYWIGSFTKSGQELIIAALESKFGIKATWNKRISSSGIEGYRIRVSKKVWLNFYKL